MQDIHFLKYNMFAFKPLARYIKAEQILEKEH